MQNDSNAQNLLLENTAFEKAYINNGGKLDDVTYNELTNQYDPNWEFEGIDSETHQLRADDVSNSWQGWLMAKNEVVEQKFPNKLVSDLWNANTTFETILHLPSLSASDPHNLSEKFIDFLSDAYDESTSSLLLKQCPALEPTLKWIRVQHDIEEYASDVLQDFNRACNELEFLILISTRKPYNFKFDQDGKYRSNSLGGYFIQDWILAKNMIEAAEIAIKMAEEIHQEEEAKARKEQGLEG